MDQIDLTFPFEILRSFIQGGTAVDIPTLILDSLDESESFLEAYGYDWNDPSERKQLERLRDDAVAFVREYLLADGDPDVPPEIADEPDLRLLLLWASDADHHMQPWSCAVLRVAHAYAHCLSYFNEQFGPAIRQQVFSRFEAHMVRDENGSLFLGHTERIPLANFEAKPSKPIPSVVMKLLHKAENVATDVFDRIGVRFITQNRFDALLVVKFLRHHNVVMFANVKPSRSRNSLIDIDWVQAYLESDDPSSLEEIRQKVEAMDYPSPPGPPNLHSAASYHSIQFTCRQLIRVPNSGEPIRFFFPFEVQIMDDDSFEKSRDGLASHDQYKRRQRESVRKRVLGKLVS